MTDPEFMKYMERKLSEGDWWYSVNPPGATPVLSDMQPVDFDLFRLYHLARKFMELFNESRTSEPTGCE